MKPRILAIFLLVATAAGASHLFADVLTPNDQWFDSRGGCLSLKGNPEKAERIRRLALILLGRSDETTGCVTFPYLGTPYDVPGVNNAAHAGIDFRANGVAVRSIDAGQVVVKSFSPSNGRSTLIIENNDRTRKTLYLHMSKMTVEQGDYVNAGQVVGTAGSIGACPDQEGGCPHLHFEVWSRYNSPFYCSHTKAISGSACMDEGGTCSLDSIKLFTTEPDEVIYEPLLFTPRPRRNTPSIPDSSRVSFDGVGDLRVGMSLGAAAQMFQDRVLGASDRPCYMGRLQTAACGLSFMVQKGSIVTLEVAGGSVRTVDEVGIGSSIVELKEVYGARLQSRPNKYNENAVDVWVDGTGNHTGRRILFVVENGLVKSYRAGEEHAVSLVEHCN